MKKIVFIMLSIFTAVTFGQAKYITAGDSILVAESNKTPYTMIFISDSSNSITDSLVIEKYAPRKKIWDAIAVMDMSTHDDWYEVIIPGDGVAKWYLVNAISTGDNIRLRRTNVTSRAQKTYAEYDKR